eukprot:s4755_g5.t1
MPGEASGEINEFSLADSFVLGVLRGFRLLQSAGLSHDEKRDILASTKGSLEFEVVTQALQTLWDEQFLGRGSMRSTMTGYFNESFQATDETYDQDWHDDWVENYWGEADYWADPEWDQWGEMHHSQPDPQRDEAPDDPQLQDAMKAEGEAEALFNQAQRTWSEAQRATAQLRKDRGFGHVRPP